MNMNDITTKKPTGVHWQLTKRIGDDPNAEPIEIIEDGVVVYRKEEKQNATDR